jgi:hypothetical protein
MGCDRLSGAHRISATVVVLNKHKVSSNCADDYHSVALRLADKHMK